MKKLSKKLCLLFLLFFVSASCFADDSLTAMQIRAEKAIQTNDSLTLMKTYKYWGDYLSDLSEYEKSDSILNLAINIALHQKNQYEAGIIYNILASNASFTGNRPLAFSYYHKALKHFADIHNADKVAMVMMNMGSEYEFGGDLEKAIAYELKALKNKENSGNKKDLDYYYQSIGQLFKENDLSKWEYYINKAYLISKTLPSSHIQTKASIFNDLGGIAEVKKDYQGALAWYDSMLIRSQKYEYINGMSTAYSNRCLVYKSMKQYDKALDDIKRALKFDETLKKKYSTILHKIHAAQVLVEMNRYAEAKKYATEALLIAQKSKSYPEEEAIAHNVLSEIGEKTNDWKSAYNHYVDYKNGIDSVRSEETNKTLHDLEIKYQTTEKEKKIVQLDTENKLKAEEIKRNRIQIFMLVISIFLILAIVAFFTLRYRLQKARESAELKQKLLRSQMNPHFIFNTLNAINQYIRNNQAEAASDYLAQYSRLMRQILENSTVEFVPLETEIDFMKNYLNMQQLRFTNTFEYVISIDNEIDVENTDVLPMIAQPFIENAIEHGLRPMKSDGILKISMEKTGTDLFLKIYDNGVGIKEKTEKQKLHKSFAIEITRERLKIYKGKDDSLVVESPEKKTGKGTLVTIKIPSKQY